MAASIQIKRGNKLAYTNLATKSADTLYFILDTGEIFLGETLMSVTDLSGYVVKDGDKVLSSNDFTDALKSKLDTLAIFSTINVNGTEIGAEDSDDTLSLVSGSNITITADAGSDKITISAKDTTYTLEKSGNNIILMDGSGAEVSKITDTDTTYGEATQSASGLMSAADKAKLDGIDAGATKNTDYELPKATASILGGIRVGAGLSMSSDGVLSSPSANLLSGVSSDASDLDLLAGAYKYGVTNNNIKALAGVDSNIQNQLDGKSSSDHTHTTSDINNLRGFSQVRVGNKTPVTADVALDELVFVEGSGITITPDANNDTITVAVNNDITESILLGDDLKRDGGKITHSNTITGGGAAGSTTDKELTVSGGSFNIPSITYDSNGHITDKGYSTITIPKETDLSVTEVPGSGLSPEHAKTFDVVTAVIKGTGSHDLSITKSVITLPSQYVLPLATQDVRGGIQVGFITEGASIPVELSDDERAFVKLTKTAIASASGTTGVTAGSGLTGGGDSGSVTLSVGAGEGISVTDDKVALATVSGLVTGSYGPPDAVTGTEGTTINVPYITVDAYGRIKSISNKVYTSKNTTYGIATYSTSGLVKPAYTSTGAADLTTVASTTALTPTIAAKTTTSGRYYGVEADKNGVLFVNVPWTNTTYTADGGIKLAGKVFSHSNSITAKTAAAQSSKSLTWGDTFKVYEEKYDAQGHVTGVVSSTMTMPSNPDTNTAHSHSAGNGITISGSGGTTGTTSISAKAGSGITVDASGINVNTGYTTNATARNYKVQVDSTTGGLYVNVPWSADTNTSYSAGAGITLTGTTFSNSGVRSASVSDGTLTVDTNGTTATFNLLEWGSF